MNQLALFRASVSLPSLVIPAGDDTQIRFVEFFAANIRDPHARRAYGRAVADFLAWCEERNEPSIAAGGA